MISPPRRSARAIPTAVFPVAVGPAITRIGSDPGAPGSGPPEAAVELIEGELQDDRAPVRTGGRDFATEEVLDQAIHLHERQRVALSHRRVAGEARGDRFLEPATGAPLATQGGDEVAQKAPAVPPVERRRYAEH